MVIFSHHVMQREGGVIMFSDGSKISKRLSRSATQA